MNAYHIAKRLKHLQAMRFYVFDSFEGLPEKAWQDAECAVFKKGDYAFTLEEVRRNLERNGVDVNEITFIKGWYKEVLNEETRQGLAIEKAAVVYIDCDMYESTVPALEFIVPYITHGTIIIFDDWYCFHARPDRGEQRAFNEWLAKNPTIRATQYWQYGWAGQSFIMHRR